MKSRRRRPPHGPKRDASAALLLEAHPNRPTTATRVRAGIAPLQSELASIPRAGSLLVARRVARWTGLLLHFGALVLADRLAGRRGPRQRGRRVREVLSRVGGTAITVGRHFAMRLDHFAPEFCEELRRIPDEGPPLPIEVALASIEKATERPMAEVFERFDPTPIATNVGSCLYQAALTDGRKVTVRVRRPKSAESLDADLRAISVLLVLLEQATIVRPGAFLRLRQEMPEILATEIDYPKRAQIAAMFRRRARKDGLHYVSAAPILREWISNDVLMGEFVSGFMLYELLAARESGDAMALLPFREKGIDPEKIARRLLHTWRWGLFETLFYFTSPTPTTVVVQKDNGIALLDFAEVGWTSPALRRIQMEFERNLRRGDIGTAAEFMIQSVLPLAHIDVHELTKQIEQRLWQCYYALRIKHSRPIERTMAGAWLAFLEVAKAQGVTVPLPTVKMIHSTLLYEELAARLWPGIDGTPFRSYLKKARRRRERRRERARRRQRATDSAVLLVGAARASERWTHVLGKVAEQSPVEFLSMASKEAYVVTMALRLAAALGYILLFAYLLQVVLGADPGLVRRIVFHPVTVAFFGLSLVLALRLVFFRLNDHDPDE